MTRESVTIDCVEFRREEEPVFCKSTPSSIQGPVSKHRPLSDIGDLFVPLHGGRAVEAHGSFIQLPHADFVRPI